MRRNLWFGVGVVLAFLGATAPEVEAKGSVRITFNTTPPAPLSTYTPNNVVALWIQNAAGQHVRTVGLWTAVRTQHLVAYRAANGINDTLTPDAVSGASRLNHQGALVAVWNLKDKAGAIVPDGTYTIRLEMAEGNSTTAGQNNQGTFTFVKGPNPQTQMNLANGGFTGVSLEFDPNAVVCGDGVPDAPETCDFAMPGSCVMNQQGCVAAVGGDKCMPEVFQGAVMSCTAQCVVQPITLCIHNDGCCAAGCSEADDVDCRPGGAGSDDDGGGSDDDVTGGCSTSPTGGLVAFALFLGIAVLRRRR